MNTTIIQPYQKDDDAVLQGGIKAGSQDNDIHDSHSQRKIDVKVPQAFVNLQKDSDTVDCTAEEAFMYQLNLSKRTESYKEPGKSSSSVKSALMKRPFTRYVQYVCSNKRKIEQVDATADEDSTVNKCSEPSNRKKKLTLSEKIANLKENNKHSSSIKKKNCLEKKSIRQQPVPKTKKETSKPENDSQEAHKNLEDAGEELEDSEEFSCETCNFSCYSKEKYEDHTENKSHIIKTEIVKGTNHELLEAEKQRWIELKMPATCSICLIEFTEREKFIRHNRSHDKSNLYKCLRCNSIFQHRGDLASHLKRHLGVRNIKCKFCDMSFDKTRNLESHMMTKHGEKDSRPRNFKCTECGEAFLSKSAVNRHMRWHTGFRPESCQFCWQSFHTKHDLLQHQRVHSGEKPYKCASCVYTARTAQLLKRHMQTHSEEKPYSCKHCTFTCRNSTGLKRHMYKHTGKKPFKCPYCSHRCVNIENLRKHIKKVKKHQGLKIYPCSHCMTYATDEGSEYLLHMKQYHFPYLDLKVATATKLSGIQVDDNSPEDHDSGTEEEISSVSRPNIFGGTAAELLRDESIAQESLALESMQPSLNPSQNILPDLGLRSTIETLSDNNLNCLNSNVPGCSTPRMEKGDIFLSSIGPFDNHDPCKAGAFTTSALFDEESCIMPTNNLDSRPHEAVVSTQGNTVNHYKLDETTRLGSAGGQAPPGLDVSSLNQGFLSVLVLQKVVISPGEENSPLTLVVNSNSVIGENNIVNSVAVPNPKISLQNAGPMYSKNSVVHKTEDTAKITFVTPSNNFQSTSTVSSFKPILPKFITVTPPTPTKTTDLPNEFTLTNLDKDQNKVTSVSLGSFMTASSINVSSTPPKILTISPHKTSK